MTIVPCLTAAFISLAGASSYDDTWDISTDSDSIFTPLMAFRIRTTLRSDDGESRFDASDFTSRETLTECVVLPCECMAKLRELILSLLCDSSGRVTIISDVFREVKDEQMKRIEESTLDLKAKLTDRVGMVKEIVNGIVEDAFAEVFKGNRDGLGLSRFGILLDEDAVYVEDLAELACDIILKSLEDISHMQADQVAGTIRDIDSEFNQAIEKAVLDITTAFHKYVEEVTAKKAEAQLANLSKIAARQDMSEIGKVLGTLKEEEAVTDVTEVLASEKEALKARLAEEREAIKAGIKSFMVVCSDVIQEDQAAEAVSDEVCSGKIMNDEESSHAETITAAEHSSYTEIDASQLN